MMSQKVLGLFVALIAAGSALKVSRFRSYLSVVMMISELIKINTYLLCFNKKNKHLFHKQTDGHTLISRR